MEQKIWQSVIGEIEVSIPKSSFDSIFKKAHLVSIKDNQIKIAVPNVFIQTFLENKFNKILTTTFKKNGIKNPKINYTTNLNKARASVATDNSSETTKTSIYNKRDLKVTTIPNSNTPVNKTGLNDKYTFENFIVGSSNDFAYMACQAVVNAPGTKYNPLFLHSGVGLGKTHLMQAVGNAIIQKNPNSQVMYVTSETFIKDFLNSIRFKQTGFSDKYRNVDVLIIDDMQFIAGKEKTQEEFFHTFNSLHQKNKQIIISSDQPPKSIPTLTERLRSRFEWGMSIDIQMPDFETRCAIIDAKASLSDIKLSMPTIEYLANNFRTNIRELEGALNQLLAFSEMRGLEPTVETAEGLLSSTKATRPQHLTSKQIITKTARYFNINIEEICSSQRSKHIITPRQIAMYLLRSELHMSFPKISKELGRKDHTTAIHSIEKIEKEIKLNPIIKDNVSLIRESLYS